MRQGVKDMPIIKASHISKVFETKDRRVEALKDVNLEVEEGDIYGIIGMSGAGKSTLVRCLNFLEVPTEGDVVVEGKNLRELSESQLLDERKQIAMIFQHILILPAKQQCFQRNAKILCNCIQLVQICDSCLPFL